MASPPAPAAAFALRFASCLNSFFFTSMSIAKEAGVSVAPKYDGEVRDVEHALEASAPPSETLEALSV